MIDPNLEGPTRRNNAGRSGNDRNGEMLAGIKDHANHEKDDVNETDTKLAHALQGFSDGQGQAQEGTEGQG